VFSSTAHEPGLAARGEHVHDRPMPDRRRAAATGHAAARLEPLRRALQRPDSGIRSFLVASGAGLVFEHHRPDVAAATPQPVNSVTKSVLGMLVGIALQQGVFAGLRQPVADFLPELRAPDVPARARAITLEHLLTMTAGFAWDEHKVDRCLLAACARFAAPGERLRFIVGRELAHPPGQRFNYDSHAAHLLSIALARAASQRTDRYAEAMLLQPLGIHDWQWETDEDGVPFGGRGLALRPRDMLSIGLLMLRRGQWEGRQLVSAGYLHASARAHSAGGWPMQRARYGYLWWHAEDAHDAAACFAAGFGGQFIFVEPRRNLVAAVTADPDKTPKHVRRLMAEHVLPAACPT